MKNLTIEIIYPIIPDGEYHVMTAIYDAKKNKAKLFCDGKKLKTSTKITFKGEFNE